MNNFDQVAGQSALIPAATTTHAFKLSNGLIQDLGTLPTHANSRAFDLNEKSVIVGTSFKATSPNDARAVVWHGTAISDLNSLLPANWGSFLRQAVAINDNGDILATAANSTAIVIRPVFGPATDINGDCKVGVPDLLLVINQWGPAQSTADVNHDGLVNMLDLLAVIRDWGSY